MFDSRLKKGVVFRIDSDAAKELNLTDGSEYAISVDANAVEVRASKFKDGKPARGRPRKFSTADVARMLGVTLAVSTPEDIVEDSSDDSEEDEARVSSLIAGTTPTAATVSSNDETPW